MMVPTAHPVFCRPEAFYYFAEQMPDLWASTGLLRAAVGVSMHALDDVDPESVEQRLADLSGRVRRAALGDHPSALFAALQQVLFNEEMFGGDPERYYHALNSYIPAVLQTRRGLPITLSLVYKLVGEGAGLATAGVNAPGHFMVRVRLERGWQIVDPFYGGETLSREQVFDRLDRIAQRKLPRNDDLLAAPTHVQWIGRLIGNLRQLFAAEGRRDDLAAMGELLAVMKEAEPQPLPAFNLPVSE